MIKVMRTGTGTLTLTLTGTETLIIIPSSLIVHDVVAWWKTHSSVTSCQLP